MRWHDCRADNRATVHEHIAPATSKPSDACTSVSNTVVDLQGRIDAPMRHRFGAYRLLPPGKRIDHACRIPGARLDGSSSSGTIVFNPGGPGESGNQILPIALQSFPLAVRQHFNIVSFDPRWNWCQ